MPSIYLFIGEYNMKYKSKIDREYKPIIYDILESNEKYDNEIKVMIENSLGYSYSYSFNASDNPSVSYPLAERIVKSLLWIVGGNKIYISGNKEYRDLLQKSFSKGGDREFDASFMENVYKKPLEIIHTDSFKEDNLLNLKLGKNFKGYKIGFDAGGSDMKISAVVDGEVIFSDEILWLPKIQNDISYHYEYIKKAFLLAMEKMPRLDGIGVSSAGIYIDNKTATASLFRGCDKRYSKEIENIYLNIRDEIAPGVPIEVMNDGDVTALAGAIYFNSNSVLGIAMGTSEAGGYVNKDGGFTGWLSELGYVPVTLKTTKSDTVWSGDSGIGGNYFSQDAVIRLAGMAGLELKGDTLAAKLSYCQSLMENGNELAYEIFRTIGIYLGYTIPFYAEFYKIDTLLLLGRVTSGSGGDLVISTAKEILKNEFPYLSINVVTADEKFKRVGQSIAAASLPKNK